MWTPKRIVLLALAVFLSVGGYAAYARHLGIINGLPPLPERYLPGISARGWSEELHPITITARKLEKAFGSGCPELRMPIKIEVPARGLVLAAKEFHIEEDGRVMLRPMSVALFGKNRGEDGTPEINTIRGDVAYLTFEHPIRTVSDIGKHRIVAGQISRNIRLVNNRRTPSDQDDIIVEIRNGPLFYEQEGQRIWTDDYVQLEDHQSKPNPTKVNGQGMVLDLMAEQPGAKTGRPQKQKQIDSVSGVRQVRLRSAVNMEIFTDARSGFLGGRPEKPAPPAGPRAAPEKAHILIATNGPFCYDLTKEFACFDKGPKTSRLDEHVAVTRLHDALGKNDQLQCEHLELQLRKKDDPAPKPSPARKEGASDGSKSLQIETAHATGKEVVLASDTDSLDAHGNDFFYDARTLTSTLKGSPMWAIKEGSTIEAKVLRIQSTKSGHIARATGPGNLQLAEKTPGKKPSRARWDDTLTSTRDGDQDVMHLTRNAVFLDEENAQELRADDLQVWLKPPEPVAANVKKNTEEKGAAGSRKPHHLIATGHVRTRSREFNILDAQRFVVWFHDAPAPKAAPAGSGGDKPGAGGPATTPPTGSAPPTAGNPPARAEEARKPIDLIARTVEAHVLRTGEKSQLEKLHSEGGVRVHQDPSKKGETGVDITGGTLHVTAFPEGNVLVVTGDPSSSGEFEVAHLVQNDTSILGPEVNIDQVANKVWVNGMGAMTLKSETDFQGNKLKKPTPLTIHWERSMVCSGRQAVFQGRIAADQENSRLTCEELQVAFDKPISLREGQKEQDRARVINLVCDKSARVEDSTYEGGELIKIQQLWGPWIAYDNVEGRVNASGPGEVRIVQHGDDSDPTAPPPPPKQQGPAAPKKDRGPLKLTHVRYDARMIGLREAHLAVFNTNVRVLHLPVPSFRSEVNFDKVLEKMPPDSLYLRCDRLEVLSRPRQAGKASQEMKASGRVVVDSPEFHGEAEKVTYDEEKDQVIFDADGGGLATLSKFKPGGAPPQVIEGRKIIYSRRTGKHTGEDIRNIQGQ